MTRSSSESLNSYLINPEKSRKNKKMKACIAVAVLLGVAFTIAGASVLIDSSQNHHNHHPYQEDPWSCAGDRCNRSGIVNPGCQCNVQCVQFQDCCPDYYTLCLPTGPGSCAGRCGDSHDPAQPCQCNNPCRTHGDCCPDFETLCGGTQTTVPPTQPITNAELEAFSEEIFALEGQNPNNVAGHMTWDLQGRTTSGSTADLAPGPLMSVQPVAYERGTIALLVAMHDNYEAQVTVPEQVTPTDSAEEVAFLDAIFATPIFTRLVEFLSSKGVAFSRAKFEQMWFGLYARGGSSLGSSGLEHVLLSELNNGVSGFHNWAFFAKEEEAGRLNYRGWMEFADLGSRGGIIQHNFQWRGANKPISSMFVGTSPEFELAVYSVCWLARQDVRCGMSFGGLKIPVTTWTIGSSKQFVASAYAM